MGFSILFEKSALGPAPEETDPPDYFADLALDQVVAAVTAGRDEYRLAPYFQARVTDVATVRYRHEVFRDLEDPRLVGIIKTFAAGMRAMRQDLARRDKVSYRYEKARWFLDAVSKYCEAVGALERDLASADGHSAGFAGFRDYLSTHVASGPFGPLRNDAHRIANDLAQIRYRLQIYGSRIRVSLLDPDEPDYSREVSETFEKFKQAAAKEYTFEFPSPLWLNHVEAEILDRVALLYPDVFAELDAFCRRNADFVDETIGRFDREVQFYLAYLEHIERLQPADLSFCYPEVTDRSRSERGSAVFDLALAVSLVREGGSVVTNDFSVDDPERLLVVSGPNQGGKTTFARMVGQIHHLAGIGVLVPGEEAQLSLVDQIFTHFEREEDLENLSGKLEEELRRIHAILELATGDSLLIMNESFGSTTVHDALLLGREILGAVIERDLFCVYVTFLDEMASLGPTTVSMTSTIEPDDPARRTFRIVRRPADGRAYALAIAEKHRLTYARVKERLAS